MIGIGLVPLGHIRMWRGLLSWDSRVIVLPGASLMTQFAHSSWRDDM